MGHLMNRGCLLHLTTTPLTSYVFSASRFAVSHTVSTGITGCLFYSEYVSDNTLLLSPEALSPLLISSICVAMLEHCKSDNHAKIDGVFKRVAPCDSDREASTPPEL